MSIQSRMKKVREIIGWKQSTVASSMHMSLLALDYIEQGHGNPGLEVLDRFCAAVNVHLYFLLATDVPVTTETVAQYGTKSFSEFISDHRRLTESLAALEGLPYTHATKNLAI